jgi:hypothetical protein
LRQKTGLSLSFALTSRSAELQSKALTCLANFGYARARLYSSSLQKEAAYDELGASPAVRSGLALPREPGFLASNPDAERKPNSTEEKKPDKEMTFEETIKGAKVSTGLFTLYQTESVPRNSAQSTGQDVHTFPHL